MPSDYDEAVKLALDLRDLAKREGEPELFSARFDGLRRRRSTRRAFFQRWKRASEGAASE